MDRGLIHLIHSGFAHHRGDSDGHSVCRVPNPEEAGEEQWRRKWLEDIPYAPDTGYEEDHGVIMLYSTHI